MTRFLVDRPVSVLMVFAAVCLAGWFALARLPVSLMPEIELPEIVVRLSLPGASVREVEDGLTRLVRGQLAQVSGLEDISSESRQGEATIFMRFGFDHDLRQALLETNEKLDRLLPGLPRDIPRPRVLRASASDLPMFHLHVYRADGREDTAAMLALSDFCEQVVRRRIEQLPEVALADLTGLALPQLEIVPDLRKTHSMGLDLADLELALNSHNLRASSFHVYDGQLLLPVRFSNLLRTAEQVRQIPVPVGGRVIRLGELASVRESLQKQTGMALHQGQRAVQLAVVKQADASLYGFSDKIEELVESFRQQSPELRFAISRDQSALLELSIQNLLQSLVWGSALAFAILLFFLRDLLSGLLIFFSLPVSLFASFLFFHLSGLSLNLVSLSGLILAVGLMIDNAIIVIDNINQHKALGKTPAEAAAEGTSEVIMPLLILNRSRDTC